MLAYAGPDGIYLLEVRTGTAQRLTRCREPECGRDFEPSWAPDGTQIVFSRQDGGGTTIQVFVVNSDGTGLQQLTSSVWPTSDSLGDDSYLPEQLDAPPPPRRAQG
jgi:Tol biopolymer transport system component